jgi:hypothetical protein
MTVICQCLPCPATLRKKLTDVKIHVLCPLKILHHTKTVGLLVPPHPLEANPILQWAQSVFPVPPGVESETLQHVTTRETEEVLVSFCQRH